MCCRGAQPADGEGVPPLDMAGSAIEDDIADGLGKGRRGSDEGAETGGDVVTIRTEVGGQAMR